MLRLLFKDRPFQGPLFHLTSIDSARNQLVPYHGHDFPEIFWLTRGSCLHCINGYEELLTEGSLVLMRPSDCHAMKREGAHFQFTNLALCPATWNELHSRYPEPLERLYPQTATRPWVQQMNRAQMDELDEAMRRLAREPQSRFTLDRALLGIWQLCEKRPTGSTSTMPDWLEDAVLRADEPEVFRKGAQGLVEVAGRSHAHVSRCCQIHLGKSPSAIVNAARMRRASHLLCLTSQSVLEVSLECGFQNPAQFHRVFKAHFKTSPACYRKN